jgi:hypothetical protein
MAIKVTVKDVPVHFTTAYSGSRGTASYMNIGAAWRSLDNKTPLPLYPRKRTPPTYRHVTFIQ